MILRIAIPTNVFSEITGLREKTVRVANLVRIMYIFRVNELVIFKYLEEDGEFYDLLDFFRLPSYLRHYVFKKKPTLRYVGVAPPIRSFLEESENFRIGVVLKKSAEGFLVHAGLSKPVLIKEGRLSLGQVVTIRNKKGKWKLYEGEVLFKIKRVDNIIDYIKKARSEGFKILATSRYGKILTIEELSNLKTLLGEKVLVLFGSYREGLFEIFKRLNSNLEDHVDFIYNFFPNQGVKTIRADEAILGVLTVLNLALS